MKRLRSVAGVVVIALLLVSQSGWAAGQRESGDDPREPQLLEQVMESHGVIVEIEDDAWSRGIRAGFREIDANLDPDNRTERGVYSFIVTSDGLGERTALIKPFPIANVDIFYTPPDYQGVETLEKIPEDARLPLGESGIDGPYATVIITARAMRAARDAAGSLDDEIKDRGVSPDGSLYFELSKGALFSEHAALALGFVQDVKPVGDGVSFDVYKWRVDDLMLFGNR